MSQPRCGDCGQAIEDIHYWSVTNTHCTYCGRIGWGGVVGPILWFLLSCFFVIGCAFAIYSGNPTAGPFALTIFSLMAAGCGFHLILSLRVLVDARRAFKSSPQFKRAQRAAEGPNVLSLGLTYESGPARKRITK